MVHDAKASDLSFMHSNYGAMVDLHQNADFEEPFYIVLLERTTQGTTVHMWRLVISSLPDPDGKISRERNRNVRKVINRNENV